MITDVPESVVGLHIVVAGVDISVVLKDRGSATGGRDSTKVVLTEPAAQGGIESHDEDLADVATHPFIENRAQERAESPRLDGACRDQIAGLRIQRTVDAPAAIPAAVGRNNRVGSRSLDDGDELYVPSAEFVTKEAIDIPSMLLVGGVYRAEYVDIDVVPAKALPGADRSREGSSAALVYPERVVQLPGAVNAESDQIAIVSEECRPVVIDRVPLVWMLCRTCCWALRYRSAICTERL